MSNYLPKITKTYEVEGDTVTVVMKRMTRAQMLEILPLLPKSEDDKDGKSTEDSMLIIEKAVGFLKDKNIESFVGLKDANGEVLKFEDIADDMYFSKFLGELVNDFMLGSKVDEKK